MIFRLISERLFRLFGLTFHRTLQSAYPETEIHNEIIENTKQMIEAMQEGPEYLDGFDEELFCELIDRIIVESNTRIRFRLKNGLELPESIERTVR